MWNTTASGIASREKSSLALSDLRGSRTSTPDRISVRHALPVRMNVDSTPRSVVFPRARATRHDDVSPSSDEGREEVEHPGP